ncbi:MAG: hypothetical protein H6712_30610 [Myxococcales bacterium]|nr:hypothetical protein [Myxococcales bacterium]MCB9718242.1 hypothetical protein [Myxococcales bacterium]
MIERALGALSIVLLAGACGPSDMSRDEVDKNLFGRGGVLGGYEFGDSWDEIKKSPDEVYEVRDEAGFEQLRRKVSDNAGQDGYFLGFGLEGGKVTSLHASVNGTQQNAVTVRMLVDDAIAYFDAMIGNGHCSSSPDGNTHCDWREQPGKPRATLRYMTFDEPIKGSIDIDVEPPE